MSRLLEVHQRLSNAFVGICRLSALCLLTLAVTLLVDLWLWPGALDSLMNSEQPVAVLLTWILLTLVVLIPLSVPWITMAFLISSMLTRQEPGARELRWSWLAWLICAIGLMMLISSDLCDKPVVQIQDCRRQVWLFVLDQFNHGSFGDVFDVFDISFSSLGFDSLSTLAKFNALAFRMLCAVSVVSLAMLWLSAPLERFAQTQQIQGLHRLTQRLFLMAGYGSLLCLGLWVLMLLLEPFAGPGFLDRLDEPNTLVWKALSGTLAVPMVVIPAIVPLFSLIHLLLSLLVGHQVRGREFVLTTFVVLVCTAGLWLFVENSACKGSAEEVSRCSEQVGGFVADQFYKGGFADIFDVYDLKLGEVDSDALSISDKLLVLNFRFLCAVYVTGVIVGMARRWSNWRSRRREKRSVISPSAAKSPAESEWPKTIFADTLPLHR
jgi:hypothetical protein